MVQRVGACQEWFRGWDRAKSGTEGGGVPKLRWGGHTARDLWDAGDRFVYKGNRTGDGVSGSGTWYGEHQAI